MKWPKWPRRITYFTRFWLIEDGASTSKATGIVGFNAFTYDGAISKLNGIVNRRKIQPHLDPIYRDLDCISTRKLQTSTEHVMGPYEIKDLGTVYV